MRPKPANALRPFADRMVRFVRKAAWSTTRPAWRVALTAPGCEGPRVDRAPSFRYPGRCDSNQAANVMQDSGDDLAARACPQCCEEITERLGWFESACCRHDVLRRHRLPDRPGFSLGCAVRPEAPFDRLARHGSATRMAAVHCGPRAGVQTDPRPARAHRRLQSRYFRSFTASMNDRTAARWSATVRPWMRLWRPAS